MECCYSNFQAELDTLDEDRLDPLFMLFHPMKGLNKEDQDAALENSLETQGKNLTNALLKGVLVFQAVFIDDANPEVILGASTLTIPPAEGPSRKEDVPNLQALWFQDQERRTFVGSILTRVNRAIVDQKKHRRVGKSSSGQIMSLLLPLYQDSRGLKTH